MKIKTSELTGAALDWAVAKCEPGALCNWPNYTRLPGYSADPAQGHPIIERALIRLWNEQRPDGSTFWTASKPPAFREYGPTALIAAMRCYVVSKLGDEVEVPEELV